MSREIIRRKVHDLKPGSNVRKQMPDEDTLRRLGKSLRQGQQTPLLIDRDGNVIDGHCRLAGAILEGIDELDCIVVDGDLSNGRLATMQLVSAVHRHDISDYDKAVAIRTIKDGHPDKSNVWLAEELIHMPDYRMTPFLSLWECIPEVIEAAAAGN